MRIARRAETFLNRLVSESWTNGELPHVSEAVRPTVAPRRPVVAICAVTLALAYGGLLDDRVHTSNGNNFLPKNVPEHHGGDIYRASPAVRDRCVITANGLAPFAFPAGIFRAWELSRSVAVSEGESRRVEGSV